MANLVAPIQSLQPYEERIIEFKGLNRRNFVEEGEMSDMKNLTSDSYPLLTPRKLRGSYDLPDGVSKPLSIMTKFDRLAMIAQKDDDSIAFFYDGNEITSVTGITADTQMVAINTKICFFPQKSYLTLIREGSDVTVGEFGYIEASSVLTDATVTISNTDARITLPAGHKFVKNDAIDIQGSMVFEQDHLHESDGTKTFIFYQSAIAWSLLVPEGVRFCVFRRETVPFELWLCAVHDEPFTFEMYKGSDSTAQYSVQAKLTDGHYVASYHTSDPRPSSAIVVAHVPATSDPEKTALMMAYGFNVNASCIIEEVEGNTLILPRETFIELTAEGALDIAFTGTVKREAPDIIHVIEWNNRLWGVSDKDNTIYACKLGDPTNWKYYQGTSLDSYYAQQGTDEEWTGSAAYASHLIFFKENRMTKIYGTSPSTFQVTNTRCFGVEKGSSKSIVVLNNVVLYKSTIGIMAYEGGDPYSISEKLNNKFKNVVAGTEGIKYYASIQKEDDTYELLVLDIEKACWHIEDDVRFRSCTLLGSRLLFINDVDTDSFEKDKIYIVNPETASELRRDRKWMAVFGAFDESIENQKIFSKMSLRLIPKTQTIVNIYIKMDDGGWERIKQIAYAPTGGITVPIVPRRCDRFYIKIEGTGDCEIKSLTRRFRRGSGVRT